MAADPLADPFLSSQGSVDPSITNSPTTNFGSAFSSPGGLSSTNLSTPSLSTDFSALNDPNYFSSGATDTGTLSAPSAPSASPPIPTTAPGATPTAAPSTPSSGFNLGSLGSLGTTLGNLAPSLLAGGIGLSQAKGAQNQSAAFAAQLTALGGPYTAAGQQLLKQWQSQQITPAQQNVVSTLNAQGTALESSAAPLSAIAQAAYQNYQSGTLPAADEQRLKDQVASQKQQLRQQLASAGITDSTILAGQDQQIENQAQLTRQQLLDARFATGNVAYDQWLTSTTQGQALQAEAAKFAATSLDTMLTQSLNLGAEGMAPITQAIQLQIQSDAALSAQVNQLMGNLASAYAYQTTGGKPPGAAPGGGAGAPGSAGGAAGAVGAVANLANKAFGGGGAPAGGGGGYTSGLGTGATAPTNAFDPNFFNPSLQQPIYDAYGNPVTDTPAASDPFSALNDPGYFTDTSTIQPISDPTANPSAAGGEAATSAPAGTSSPDLGNLATAASVGAGALGVYGGIKQGGAVGDTRAAVGATQLAGKAGLVSPQANKAAGELGNVLGIYSGIKQGGVAGYGGAAVNTAQLAERAGVIASDTPIGQAIPYVGAALSVYNAYAGYQSGDTGGDALRGAEAGAAVGSVIPGIGTLIGAVVGGIAGAISSVFGSGKPGKAAGSWDQLTKSNALASNPGRSFTQRSWAEAFKGMLDEGNNIFAGGGKDRHKDPDALAKPLEAQVKAGMTTLGPNATTDQVYNQVIVPWMQSNASGLNWSVLKNEPQQQLMIKSAVDRVLAGEPIVRAEMTGAT